jgi:hypothetical protein
MKVKVCDATPVQLNWMVAMAEGDRVYRPRIGRPSDWDREAYLRDGSDNRWVVRVQNPKVAHYVDWTYCPSRNWMEGGPIIEREGINLDNYAKNPNWSAWTPAPERDSGEAQAYGPTPLIAAMRCYVASKLGDTVDVPEELT